MASTVTTMLIFMHIQHNYLKLVRKRSSLTQSDIAALLNLSDYSNICRWERGHHSPNMDALMLYHLLFDVPIETLFDRQKSEYRATILERIRAYLLRLKALDPDPKLIRRMGYLESTLTRLTA
jgi:transcriptional regulator with XRE-family HTH domain